MYPVPQNTDSIDRMEWWGPAWFSASILFIPWISFRDYIYFKSISSPCFQDAFAEARQQLFLLLIHRYWKKENWLVCHKSYQVIVVKKILLEKSRIRETPHSRRTDVNVEGGLQPAHGSSTPQAVLGGEYKGNLTGCIAFKGIQKETGHCDRG